MSNLIFKMLVLLLSIMEKADRLSQLRLPHEIPQAEWFKQQRFIYHSSGGWEIQDQGASQVSS